MAHVEGMLISFWLFAAAAFLGGCSNLPTKFDPRDLETCSWGTGGKCREVDRYQAASSHTQEGVKKLVVETWTELEVKQLVEAGISLSDRACDNWLRDLEHSDRRLGLGKDFINIVANAAAGLAGLNGASAKSLGQAAILLGGVNAGFDAYRTDVILGVIPKIRKKLEEGRGVARENLKTAIENLMIPGADARAYDRLEVAKFDTATRLLRDYHETCSAGEIQALLETSLANVKYVARDSTIEDAASQARIRVASTALRAGITGHAASDDLSSDVLYGLWLLQFVPETDRSSAPFTMYASTVEVKALATQLDGLKASAPTRHDEQISRLLAIGSLLDFQVRYSKDKSAAEAAAKAAAVQQQEEAKAKAISEAGSRNATAAQVAVSAAQRVGVLSSSDQAALTNLGVSTSTINNLSQAISKSAALRALRSASPPVAGSRNQGEQTIKPVLVNRALHPF